MAASSPVLPALLLFPLNAFRRFIGSTNFCLTPTGSVVPLSKNTPIITRETNLPWPTSLVFDILKTKLRIRETFAIPCSSLRVSRALRDQTSRNCNCSRLQNLKFLTMLIMRKKKKMQIMKFHFESSKSRTSCMASCTAMDSEDRCRQLSIPFSSFFPNDCD